MKISLYFSVPGIFPRTITRGTEVCLMTINIDAPILITRPISAPKIKVIRHVRTCIRVRSVFSPPFIFSLFTSKKRSFQALMCHKKCMSSNSNKPIPATTSILLFNFSTRLNAELFLPIHYYYRQEIEHWHEKKESEQNYYGGNKSRELER